jgi:hypothetical protein
MKLDLPYPLIPEYAPYYAQNTVETMKKMGITLDYSPASAVQVDEIIERFRISGHTPASVGNAMLGLGCYLGQVLVMNAIGAWRKVGESAVVVGWPIVIELPDGNICNPIGKAFKRLVNGEEDSVASFIFVVIRKARENKDVFN